MSEILPFYSKPIQTINKNYQGLNIQEASPEFLKTLLSNKKEIQNKLVKTSIEDRLNTLQELANIG